LAQQQEAHDVQWTAFPHYWLLSYRWGTAAASGCTATAAPLVPSP
jgi:hypothetical protein